MFVQRIARGLLAVPRTATKRGARAFSSEVVLPVTVRPLARARQRGVPVSGLFLSGTAGVRGAEPAGGMFAGSPPPSRAARSRANGQRARCTAKR
jgi:hypothetical protein